MNKLIRKMSPEAQAAAHALARRLSAECDGPEPEIAETMTGGRAFITEMDGIQLAVIIQEQDETGPLMTYEPRPS